MYHYLKNCLNQNDSSFNFRFITLMILLLSIALLGGFALVTRTPVTPADPTVYSSTMETAIHKLIVQNDAMLTELAALRQGVRQPVVPQVQQTFSFSNLLQHTTLEQVAIASVTVVPPKVPEKPNKKKVATRVAACKPPK